MIAKTNNRFANKLRQKHPCLGTCITFNDALGRHDVRLDCFQSQRVVLHVDPDKIENAAQCFCDRRIGEGDARAKAGRFLSQSISESVVRFRNHKSLAN
jgi:hypothetical protein